MGTDSMGTSKKEETMKWLQWLSDKVHDILYPPFPKEPWTKRNAICSHCRAIIEVVYHGDSPWLNPVICQDCVDEMWKRNWEAFDKLDAQMEKDNAEMAKFFEEE